MLSFQAWKQSIWRLSACDAKSWQENRNRPSYLGAYKRDSHATPNVKTHAAGEYTNTYGGRFDGETGENTTLQTERTRPGLQSRCTSSAFPEWVEWSAADKTNTQKKASTRSNQSPTPSRIYPELIVRAAQHTASMQRVLSPIDWCYVLKWFEMIPWAPTWWSWIAVVNYDVISQTRHSACRCRTVGSCKKF